MAHSGPKKVPQTRPGSLFPKIIVLGWQEVNFGPFLGFILFLFYMMFFGYKLSNLSLSVSFSLREKCPFRSYSGQ